MSPEQIVKLAIGAVVLFCTFVAYRNIEARHRFTLTPFGVIGGFFLLSGLVP